MRGLWRKFGNEPQIFADLRKIRDNSFYRRVLEETLRERREKLGTTKYTLRLRSGQAAVQKGKPHTGYTVRPRISPVPPAAQAMSFGL